MNIDELINYLFSPVGLAALVIGIAELCKRCGLPSKWIPLVDVVLGIVGGFFVFGLEMGYGAFKGIIIGIAIGLSACGLFSGIKNTIGSEEDNK